MLGSIGAGAWQLGNAPGLTLQDGNLDLLTGFSNYDIATSLPSNSLLRGYSEELNWQTSSGPISAWKFIVR